MKTVLAAIKKAKENDHIVENTCGTSRCCYRCKVCKMVIVDVKMYFYDPGECKGVGPK